MKTVSSRLTELKSAFRGACSPAPTASTSTGRSPRCRPGGLFGGHAGEALYNAARQLIAEDPPSRYHPQMKAELSGPMPTGIANRLAIEQDLAVVTTSCLLIVVLSIGFYFRRLRAIQLTGIPAFIGTAMAFGVADLTFGYLNSSTAFLGTIIVGNGINYAIVFMSRYEEERSHGRDPLEALRCALGGTWRGTLVASIAASAAYASLTVTSFRGFSQFGVMGAVGALLLGRDLHGAPRAAGPAGHAPQGEASAAPAAESSWGRWPASSAGSAPMSYSSSSSRCRC